MSLPPRRLRRYMEQSHGSRLIEHFINAQDNAHLLLDEDDGAVVSSPGAPSVEDEPADPEQPTPEDSEPGDSEPGDSEPGSSATLEDAGTELRLSPEPAEAPEDDEGDAAEDEGLPAEEVFSLDDVNLDEDTAEHVSPEAAGPAVLDVEGTAAPAQEPEVPEVEPAALTVREEQGRVWVEVPSDASTESVIAGLAAVELGAGVLWLALDARPTTADEVRRLAAAAEEALGRPVAGVRVYRGGLADGLRQQTGLTVEIDGDNNEKSASAESRGRQVLVVERTLRSGTSTRFRGDILVYGDVNAGAEVEAAGNIIVLGSLRGLAWAGSGGDDSAMIISFDLRPTQVRIGRRIAFLPERPRGRAPRLPEVAVVQDDEIVLREYRGRLG